MAALGGTVIGPILSVSMVSIPSSPPLKWLEYEKCCWTIFYLALYWKAGITQDTSTITQDQFLTQISKMDTSECGNVPFRAEIDFRKGVS